MAVTTPEWRHRILGDWGSFAHGHQREPVLAANGKPWTTWLMLGGRGAGKTRAGAEWVRAQALADPNARIALIGETEHDVREVMIEGVSGLLPVHAPHERPRWIPTRARLEWGNGAVAQAFSADVLIAECAAFTIALGHALWHGEPQTVNGFANLSGLIMAYMAARFGVLGVYVSGRSREKQAAATGQPAPTVLRELINTAIKRK